MFVCVLSFKGFIELCANGTGVNNIGTSCCALLEFLGLFLEVLIRMFNSLFIVIVLWYMIVFVVW